MPQWRCSRNGQPEINPRSTLISAPQSSPWQSNSAENTRYLYPNVSNLQWNAVYKLATDQTVSSDERNTALRNLGRTRNPQLIQKTLDLALNEVKEQDIYLPFQGLRTHPEGIRALWKFAKDNWDTIVKKLPPGLTMLGSVVQIVTNSFTSTEAISEIQEFFKDKSTKGFDQGLAQSLDSVKAKASWLERDAQDVRAWLAERGYLKGKL